MSMPESPAHAAANWFEIPVRDIELAQRFYEAILDRPLARERMGAYTLAIFPHHPGTSAPAIRQPPTLSGWCGKMARV